MPKRNTSSRSWEHGDFNKIRVRTERMNICVRLAFCGLALTASAAFFVAALKPYRDLDRLKTNLAEVRQQESGMIDRKDAKERELKAVEEDPSYLELVARDRLNYYKPGEHVFRIELR